MSHEHGQHGTLFFDRQDRDILVLVNRLRDGKHGAGADCLFDPSLHPHGIKELVATPVFRIAYAVANLLNSLDSGITQARDRLSALQSLYDEVLNNTHTSLRRNTARVLVQIMKRMVQATGRRTEQLKLAHDFRSTVQGSPRIVRRMLARYHLPEMPEDWSQIAFDDHVYDANTKGRKTPTHLVMDAWIKGLRALTVVYGYCMDPAVAEEFLRAAEITGIIARVGLEYQCPFRDAFITLYWIPRGFSSNQDFLAFLEEPAVVAMMNKGRKVVEWRKGRTLACLARWNAVDRPRLEAEWDISIPELPEETFIDYVGQRQTCTIHLAECLHRHLLPCMRELAQRFESAGDEESLKRLHVLETLSPEVIIDEWLVQDDLGPDDRHLEGLPELLTLSPQQLVQELTDLNPGYRLTLDSTGLSVEDVAELLWECKGAITHLEIFNLKGWVEGRMQSLDEIGELQRALNLGQGSRLKQLLQQMTRNMEVAGDLERAAKFKTIQRMVPVLWEHYRNNPLKSRMGSKSASRLSYGMGFIFRETLPRRGQMQLIANQPEKPIPIFTPVTECLSYREHTTPTFWQNFWAGFRRLPGCSHLGMRRSREWQSTREKCQVSPAGNMLSLGGLVRFTGNNLLDKPEDETKRGPGLEYLNSGLTNLLKVLVGFVPAFASFLYTQNWWFLAWFGTIIWFGITGVRNVIQMVLAAKGINRNTLLNWRNQVNVSRLCDSLMYTGISVLLLEVIVREWLLNDMMHVTIADNPTLVFTVLNIVNGFYICAHNVYRGFPREAAIANLFRSAIAIPVSSLYNVLFFNILLLCGTADPSVYIIPSAAVISKMASDTVAAVIEGYADSQVNLRIRIWDYKTKLASILNCYTRLELLLPQENALAKLAKPNGIGNRGGTEARDLERVFVIHALDLLYFWFYQPRAQDAFIQLVRNMPQAERTAFLTSQLVLMHRKEISQMFVDGLLGRNFDVPLAFYLSKYRAYLRDLARYCSIGKSKTALFGGNGK
ncbi:MAG: hypothetical protein LBR22_06945 [Desulfovibrio sp.]|nr:hypothetical protein [Desulfovibrio sp.]